MTAIRYPMRFFDLSKAARKAKAAVIHGRKVTGRKVKEAERREHEERTNDIDPRQLSFTFA